MFTARFRAVNHATDLNSMGPDPRAYSQNHVLTRLKTHEMSTLHRVDGISQLYFDDIPGMMTAMSSPEQEACIVDLRSFLTDVTLLIQNMGATETVGSPVQGEMKLFFLLGGTEVKLSGLAKALTSRSARIRLNPIIARDITVDESISAGDQVVDAVFEVWFDNEATRSLVNKIILDANEIRVLDGFAVHEHQILRL